MTDPPRRPQLSVSLASYTAEDPGGWAHLLEAARTLDRAGVDRLVVSDHVVFGERLEEYARPEVGGITGGRQPTGPDGHWLEPLTVLSFVAGVTERIRLGTGILLAALRRPVVLAKTAATLDVLSGGRLDLGVGVGWQREEYEAAGLSFEGRGDLLDRTLQVCQTLWRDTRASYQSPGLSFDAIHMMPKPAQAGGVPVWVSGRVNSRVVRRVAEHAAGWIPWGDDAADVVGGIRRMREALDRLGVDASGLQVVGHLRPIRRPDQTLDLGQTFAPVPELWEAGVTDFRLGQLSIPTDPAEALDRVSAVVAAFQAAGPGLSRPMTST